jgi:hypothetical protein
MHIMLTGAPGSRSLGAITTIVSAEQSFLKFAPNASHSIGSGGELRSALVEESLLPSPGYMSL